MGDVDGGTLKRAHALPFMLAVGAGREGLAISYVRDGSMPVTDTISWGGATPAVMSPLQVAVAFNQAALLGAIVAAGADVDRFTTSLENFSHFPAALQAQMAAMQMRVEMTAVGTAVQLRNPGMLKVLRCAGADLGLAMRKSYGEHLQGQPHPMFDPGEYSALQQALISRSVGPKCVNIECVRYLLGEGRMDARMPCNVATQVAVRKLASQGDLAVPVLKMLVAGGFDLVALDSVNDAAPKPFTVQLLGIAAQAGGKKLLRYLVKDLKLSGDSDDASMICELMDCAGGAAGDASTGRSGLDMLSKRSCSFCGSVCKTNKCGRCNKVQYCDKQCQKRHWNPGHKAECTVDSTHSEVKI